MTRKQKVPPVVIKRTAIDCSGRLGSLYNGCQDRIVGTLDVTIDNSLEILPQISQCSLLKGNPNRNLLELIDINEQLRLSLLLNLTPKNGISNIIDHPHLINEYTRIFRYSYLYREEHLPVEILNMRELLSSNTSETNATHIITGISWGVDIIVVLQLPLDDHLATMIDLTLEKYRTYLNGDRNDFKRTREDINAMERILDTKTYSNISALNEITVFHDLFHNISRFKADDIHHQPLTYNLHPIQSIYHRNPSPQRFYKPLNSTSNIRLEQHLVELSTAMKIVEMCFNEDMQSLLCGHFKERLVNASRQWAIAKQEYPQAIEQYAKLVCDIRSNQIRISTINKKLRSKRQLDMKNRIDHLTKDVINLNAKGHLISDLVYQQIQYCNVADHNVTMNDDETSIKQKLMVNENTDLVLCSNDVLNKTNPTLFRQLRHNLLDELTKNLKSRLIYADFSYSDYQLQRIMILPSNENQNKAKSKQKEVSFATMLNTSISSSPSKPPTTETINILLLGEVGVGKSTFINALINYLTFQTLDKAHSNNPLVAVPTSFPMTTSDSTDAYTIKIDDFTHSKNEDSDHPGQSATQHCRSYRYNLNEKTKLRIIDTPGFGDTRGINHDDRNMQHILQYIKKINNLHAICILLKPNESRMNVFLPSCLTQLFNLFGPSIRDNITFCFTNSRSTSYTPGNTIPLLKNLLSSLSIRRIPLKKKNIFCFDNETFHYFIAHQNNIPFSDQNKQEYELSWKHSVAESNRLMRYIQKKLHSHPVPDESELIKHIKVKIAHLTHPMIESMRYILRNIIMNKIHSSKSSIESLANDDPTFQHLPHQPLLVDFLQDYKITNGSLAQKQDDMIDHLSLFSHISAELGYFLVHVACYHNGDPFLTGLFRLIREETAICENHNRDCMNLQLVDGLKKLASNYEQRIQDIKSNSKQTTLTDTYEWVKYINQHPLISGYVIDSTRITIENGNRISLV